MDGPRFARTWQREIRRTLITENEQWQLGEFAGSDSGSPVQATMGVETQPVLQPSVRHSACSMAKDDWYLERTYDAPVARLWEALTDEAAKRKWFGGTPGHWELLERHMDVRVGGSEGLKGRCAGGVVSTFDITT